MSCAITKGRTEPCRNNIGGVKNVYFFNYNPYTAAQITIEDGFLNSFPSSTVYKYDVVNTTFVENINNDDENGVSYSQNLSIRLLKQDLPTTKEINKLKDLIFNVVVEYESGVLRVLGLFNGCTVSGGSIAYGGAKNEFNGYEIQIEAQEEIQAPFITSLDIITGNVFNYIFMDGENFIFMDENNYIFN